MPSKKATANRYRAPALEKGLDILEVLADSRLPMSQAELAETLVRSQGEFFRMLTCLERRGYVIRESESGRYKLTMRLYELGHKQHAVSMLRNAARIPMEELADKVGQACHLSVQSGSSVLILMERMPSRRICLAVGEGTTFPIIDSMSGRMLLSRMSTEECDSFLSHDETFRSKSLRERRVVLNSLQSLRGNEDCIAPSFGAEGVTDIGTMVGVLDTDTVGVLIIPTLTNANQKNNDHAKYLDELRRAGREIDKNLGIAK